MRPRLSTARVRYNLYDQGDSAMQQYFVLASLVGLMALSGCQTYEQSQAWRYQRDCPDRPMESGLCQQDTNWRLFDPDRWGVVDPYR